MERNLSDVDARRKMKYLIEDIGVCMFCTMREDGSMHSRPMSTMQVDHDNALWFFTDKQTKTSDELSNGPSICLNYSDPRSNDYLCVVGNAELVSDRKKVKELWNPMAAEFFSGADDPNIALIKVTPIEASYWDVHTRKMETLFEMIGSIISGNHAKGEEHGNLTL